MTPTRPAHIAVGAALDWELRAVLRALGDPQRARCGDMVVWRARCSAHPLTLYRTGVGCESAARRSTALLAAGGIDMLINTGCAGSLRDDVPGGALFVADAVIGPLPSTATRRLDGALAARLRDAVRAAGLSSRSGLLLTSPEPLLSATSKRRHGDLHGAGAVDMESAAVAAAAHSHGARVASLRAILDGVDLDLPQPPAAASQNRVPIIAAATHDALAQRELRTAERNAESALQTAFSSLLHDLAAFPLLV